MECSSDMIRTTTTTIIPPHRLSISPPSPPPPRSSSSSVSSPATVGGNNGTNSTPSSPTPPIILSPCAACKILRRRCVEKCVLAPYFPPTEPLKFTIAHKVFGASNIIKMLQELPEEQRADAVNSMVYEANARIRDPVYGCAGAICQLQKQISDLQAELAKAKAQNLNIQCQNENLISSLIIYMGMTQQSVHHHVSSEEEEEEDHKNNNIPIIDQINTSMFLDDANLYGAWEPLWT